MMQKPPFDQWLAQIAEIQKQHPSHQNQEQYDRTLSHNYVWPWTCLSPVSAPGTALLYDIGCAYGSMSIGARLLGYSVHALDVTNEYVSREALKAQGISFNLWDITAPQFPPYILAMAKADVVIFTEVLEHIDVHPLAAIQKIHGLLKPGGLLIFSTPRREDVRNHAGVDVKTHWSTLPASRPAGTKQEDKHHHLYSEAELYELLHKAGFSVHDKALLWDGLGIGLTARAL